MSTFLSFLLSLRKQNYNYQIEESCIVCTLLSKNTTLGPPLSSQKEEKGGKKAQAPQRKHEIIY